MGTLIFSCFIVRFLNYVWWRILGKMGYVGWLRVLLLLLTGFPVGGLGLGLLWLGFEKWPIHERMEQLEKRARR